MGNKVRIGGYTWIGCKETFRLSKELTNDLYFNGNFLIGGGSKSQWSKCLFSRLEINRSFEFRGRRSRGMESIYNFLKHGSIKLSYQENLIKCYKNKGSWEYIDKLGYSTRMEESKEIERAWWWKVVWK
jgi:hypothetical protein